MITGEIKNKIDNIWFDIYSAGMSNPLTVIEQLSYLMFIHSLDEKEIDTEKKEKLIGVKREHIFAEDKQNLRWSKFRNLHPDEIFDIVKKEVFPFIKEIHGNTRTAFSEFMKEASFQIPNAQTLEKVISGLDGLYNDKDVKNQDMLGDIYEYMLSKLSASGQNGQFRTPKQIRDMMVNLVAPTPDDCICDPACGTAGFLISSAEYIRTTFGDKGKISPKQWEHYNKGLLTGFDTDTTMLRISSMNLMLHSINEPAIEYQDSVSKSNYIEGKFDVILANPPFTGSVNESTINPNLSAICKTKKTELLFVALFLRMLKKGGRCACVVPDGVLFGASNAHKALRKEIVENNQLSAVISMPSGVFKPYAGVSTAVLVFTKTGAGGTKDVWFYDMKSDGFSLDDKRNSVEQNDIPDIIERFAKVREGNITEEKERKRTEQSFFVPKEEIVNNDYDLSINKYKEVVYEKVEYPPTKDILAEIEKLDQEAAKELAELKKLL